MLIEGICVNTMCYEFVLWYVIYMCIFAISLTVKIKLSFWYYKYRNEDVVEVKLEPGELGIQSRAEVGSTVLDRLHDTISSKIL